MTWTLTFQVGAAVVAISAGAYLYARHLGHAFDRRFQKPSHPTLGE